MTLFNNSSPPQREDHDACMCFPLHVNDACAWCPLLINKTQCMHVQRKQQQVHVPFTCRGKNAHECIVILSTMAACRSRQDEELLNKVIIFVFFVHKKYFRSFVKLWLNHWHHMDYFTDVLATFLGLGTFQLCSCLWRVRELLAFIKNILISVPKMNEVLRVWNHMRVSN